MDAPDDDGWQWQAELEEQQQIELNERTERTGEANGNGDFCFGCQRYRKEHFDAQFGPDADPFDSGFAQAFAVPR
jgi:hypothetical protein